MQKVSSARVAISLGVSKRVLAFPMVANIEVFLKPLFETTINDSEGVTLVMHITALKRKHLQRKFRLAIQKMAIKRKITAKN